MFARVCRKWKFTGFEMGPATKRVDKTNLEVCRRPSPLSVFWCCGVSACGCDFAVSDMFSVFSARGPGPAATPPAIGASLPRGGVQVFELLNEEWSKVPQPSARLLFPATRKFLIRNICTSFFFPLSPFSAAQIEDMVHELLVVLEGSAVAQRLDQHVRPATHLRTLSTFALRAPSPLRCAPHCGWRGRCKCSSRCLRRSSRHPPPSPY